MADLCVVCRNQVRPRQHALECETCKKWQHRICESGVSQKDYFKVNRGELTIDFICNVCKRADQSPTEDLENRDVEMVEALDTVFGHSAMNITYTLPPLDSLDRSFDISAPLIPEDPLNESDMDDPQLTNSILEDTPVTYEIVEQGTIRQSKKLVSSDGFSYTVKKMGETVTRWRCSVRGKSLWCKATIIQRGSEFKPGSVSHIHQADPGIVKKTKIRANVVQKASVHAYKSAGDIVDEAFDAYIDNNDFNLPNHDYLQRIANRRRQKLRPAEPQPQDLDFDIDVQFLDCEDFLVGDLKVDTARHIMFATQPQLDLLQNARRWYLDGTFKIVRKPFHQLFSIHVFIQKDNCLKQVPVAFVLMSRRKKKDYIAVFNRINELCPTRNVQGFVLDFEAATWKAVREVYPGTDIKGCAFHWGQAVMKKVASLGLKTTFNQRKAVHLYVKKLLALAFFPAQHIPAAFQQLAQSANTQPLQDLVTFISNTWMNSPHWTHGQWSVFQQPIRTNNDVEGWHRRLNSKAGKSKLHFYLLVPLLRKEANSVTITMRSVEEHSMTRRQRGDTRKIGGKLHTLWEKYENQELRTSDFLREVSNIYTTQIPDTDNDDENNVPI